MATINRQLAKNIIASAEQADLYDKIMDYFLDIFNTDSCNDMFKTIRMSQKAVLKFEDELREKCPELKEYMIVNVKLYYLNWLCNNIDRDLDLEKETGRIIWMRSHFDFFRGYERYLNPEDGYWTMKEYKRLHPWTGKVA